MNLIHVVITADRKLFLIISREFNITCALFISPYGRPNSRPTLHLSKYGSTYVFSGFAHAVEEFFVEKYHAKSGGK
jgi:hypothetical protein